MRKLRLFFLMLIWVMSMSAFAVSTTIDGISYELDLNNRTAAVSGSTLANVVVPATIVNDGITFTVTSVGYEAFYGNKTITSFKTANTIKIINSYAFDNASNLQKVDIGNALQSIGVRAFTNCTSLKYIVLPNSINTIVSEAFYGCSQLNIICLKEGFNTGLSKQTIYPSSFFTFGDNTFEYNGTQPEVNYTFNGIGSGFQPTEVKMDNLEKIAGTHTTNLSCAFANSDMSFTVDIPYTYTITPIPLTARVKDATRVYGDANPQFQTEYTGFISGEDESVITNRGTYSTSATAKSDVGTYSVSLAGASAQNYTFTYESGTLAVTKAPLTMTARDKTMEYGGRMPSLEVDYSGLKNNETKPVWTTEPTVSTTASSTSKAGTYPITISGGVAKNYDVTYKKGTLTINKVVLTATTKDATRIYGDENPDFELTYSGLKNGETEPVWTVAPSFATPATKTSPVGTYSITVTGGETQNYMVQYVNKGKLTVNKASLTATARSMSRLQGEANPTFVIDYEGFKNGETVLALTQEPIATTTATLYSRPGTYPINVSGGVAMNYDFTYVNGTLTVLPKDEPGNPTDNMLTLNSISGNKGTQVDLPVGLKNDKQITGLQFDLYLPEGMTVATNARGKMLIEATDRMDRNFSISSNTIGNFVRVTGYSPDGDAFTGNEGDILNITLNIGEDVADGDYTVRIKDIVLSDVTNTEYHPADIGATVTVKSYVIGDVDNSGAININDVVCIINYILNKSNGTFIAEAADVDGSGTININDVVTLINRYILMKGNAPSLIAKTLRRAMADDNYLHLANITIKPGETQEVQLLMTNTNEAKAIQGNIKLPAGLSFVTKSNGRLDVKNIDSRSEDFTLSCAMQNDGSMTFAHYSADGFAYEGSEGGIFTFKIKADEDAAAGTYDVVLSDVVISIDGVGYDIPNRTSTLTVTGTSGISLTSDSSSEGEGKWYTLNGQKLNGKPTQKGVYIQSGKKVVIK